MFGHFPLVVQHYISSTYGTDRWEDVVRRAGISGNFEDTTQYDDGHVRALINAAIAVLGTSQEVFMSQLGDSYLRKLQASGHSQLLRLLGPTFFDFVQNIDFVHTVALAKYPKADIPLFKIDSESSQNQILLHYYSSRDYLGGFVEALLRTVAREYYHKELNMQIISETTEPTFQGHPRYHVTFGIDVSDGRMVVPPEDRPTMVAETSKHGEHQIAEDEVDHQQMAVQQMIMRDGMDPVTRYHKAHETKFQVSPAMATIFHPLQATIPRNMAITPREFCEVFPYHVLFDDQMSLLQAGVQIQAIIPAFRNEGSFVYQHLDLIHPAYTNLNYENIQRFTTCPHVVRIREGRTKPLYLRGQMIEMKRSKCMLYLCSPYVASLNDLETQQMHISDLPNHDVTKYLMAGDEATVTFFKRTTKGDLLEKFMGHEGLGQGFNDLEDLNADMYCMVPSPLADVLRSGRKVDGRVYRNVTILFSDIVNFSHMVESCKPNEVVDVLNNLHQEFSKLCKIHDVFKCDAIGDAQVIVSGIPHQIANHAERVANTALAMLIKARTISSPFRQRGHEGSGCNIRIGIHTGSVVGGIIEKPIPRFVVMGDTVLLASRLESHGIANNIHISEQVYRELKTRRFEFKQRGNIEIRGRGRHTTYLIMANRDANEEMLLGQPSRESTSGAVLPHSGGSGRPRRTSYGPDSGIGLGSRGTTPSGPPPSYTTAITPRQRGGGYENDMIPMQSMGGGPRRQSRRSRRRVEPSHPSPSRPVSSHSEMVPRGAYNGYYN